MDRLLIVVLLVSSLVGAREDVPEMYQRMESSPDDLWNLEQSKSVLPTVPNSNKIGLGYNPLYGSPVCYTGTCQTDGYGHRLFNLNYTQQSQGSCTDQLLPAHVLMLCLPSIEVDAGTEIIDTLDQLQKSTMKGFEISASAEYGPVSASYKYSSQTQYMIDNMIKSNQEILYTTVRISTMKLKLFAPFMTLSDEFQHTIENLPCCNAADRDTERYIFDSIFKYYGFTYIADLTLGGIAQQNIFINKTQSVEIEQKGYDKSHEASAAFYVSFSMKPSQSNNTTNQNEFMKLVKKTSLTKLGGDTSIQTFEEWSKTVPSNPAVIKLGVEYWFDLLDEKRFPNDKNILEKRKLIEQAFNKYVSNPVFCYSNCSSNGICQPTGYFQFGTCKCNEGWSGPECANKVLKKDAHSGTLCGLKQAIACDDAPSSSSCPSNWKNVPEATLPTMGSQIPYKGIGLSFCSKSNTDTEMSKKGTICGLSYGSLSVRCDDRNTNSEQCPTGYRRGEISLWGSMTRFCYKNNDTIDDRPGTICGLQTKISGNNIYGMLITEVACDDYYPGRGSCPPGYILTTGQATIQAPFNMYTSATYNVSVSVCSTVKHETDIFGSLIPSIG